LGNGGDRSDELVQLGDGIAARVRSGDGDAVLWIHGYTMDSSIWSDLWDRLPAWSHIGIDLPGHGASRPIRDGETLPQLARRLGSLAGRHDVRHVVALSFGTLVALQVAIEHPAALDSLVLAAPAVGGGPQDDAVGRRYVEVALAYGSLGPGPELTALWMRSPPDVFKGALAVPRVRERLRSVIDRHRWTELADGSLRTLAMNTQPREELARVDTPTLVLVGEDDLPMAKETAELLRAWLPRCTRVDLAGLGHLCLIEDPARAAAPVAEHLRAAQRLRRGTPAHA
jgi:2-succinyl-6-hydroxy-2,4-cyclohexadiene-1-carboxylate synthase